MSFGLQAWDGDGVVVFDPPKRIARFIGSVETGTSPGSATVSVPADGGQMFFFTHVANGDMRASHPEVSLNGATLSWTFASFTIDAGDSFRVPATIYYGVY